MILRCREVANRTTDFIDGELDLVSRLKIRLHLLACRQCRRFVGQMRATVGLLGRGIDNQAPAPVSDDLLAAYRNKNHRETE